VVLVVVHLMVDLVVKEDTEPMVVVEVAVEPE
jgi:hypothetical protein